MSSKKPHRYDPFAELRLHLWQSVAIIFIVSLVGTAGYMLLQGFGLLDAAYMTIITLATVGYGETRPLTPAGRVFTIALIITGVVAVGNLVNQLARAVSEGYFREGLKARRRDKMIASMQDHFIVCGYGRIGQQICKDLMEDGAALVVVEKDPELCRRAEEAGMAALQGDASSDQLLSDAGIERASCVLCGLPSDAENLYIVVSAKLLNPRLRVIARANSEEGARKLSRAGADHVVSPYLTGARRMAAHALRPQVVALVEAVSSGSGVYIEEFLVPGLQKCPLIGRTLGEADLHRRTGALVLALRRHEGRFMGNPDKDTRLKEGDLLICLGSRDQLTGLARILVPDQPAGE